MCVIETVSFYGSVAVFYSSYRANAYTRHTMGTISSPNRFRGNKFNVIERADINTFSA